MKPKDIIVGQQYIHLDYPGTRYLGVGREHPNKTNVYTMKALMVIDHPPEWVSGRRNLIGKLVMLPKHTTQDFWDRFRPVND